jgi:hypothetical protein
MTTQIAEAILTASFETQTITGFLNIQQGLVDELTGSIKAPSDNRWGALSGTTWAAYNTYTLNPEPIIWTSDLQDLGSVQNFTVAITATGTGSVDYYIIYASETGAFAGEETIVKIVDGDDVQSFYGQYFFTQVKWTGGELASMDITASGNTITQNYRGIDTSTLAGTASERTLSFDFPISGIVELKINPRAATSYPVNLYVSDTATSQVLIPVIKSLDYTTPSFALYGIDNDPRDGTVDITITAMPRQVMSGNNLYVIN